MNVGLRCRNTGRPTTYSPGETIAAVGLSANQLRPSYFVGYCLQRHGHRVIPVNPRETEILGQTSYPTAAPAAAGDAADAGEVIRPGQPVPDCWILQGVRRGWRW